MPELEVVKAPDGKLCGFGAANDAKWSRFKTFTQNLAPGEFFTLEYRKPRNYLFLKKFFAMLNLGFDAWEPMAGRTRSTYKGHVIAKNFDQFREDILILAGFGVPYFDLKGHVHWKAKSISFAEMKEDEFERVYEAVQKVLLEQVLTNYTRDDLDRVVEELQGFGS